MNKNQLHAMFKNYIDNFEWVKEHEEYYKWQVCYQYKILMDEALSAPTDQFAEALYKVKDCSRNIIDSYTQPFYGLVKYAQEEPETVRKMFEDLYANDNGDLDVQMAKIKAFLIRVMYFWINII